MTENLKKVDALIKIYNKELVAEMIGISKNTLYKRLKNDRWKKSETAIIKTLS